jgi:hypothetical protein
LLDIIHYSFLVLIAAITGFIVKGSVNDIVVFSPDLLVLLG